MRELPLSNDETNELVTEQTVPCAHVARSGTILLASGAFWNWAKDLYLATAPDLAELKTRTLWQIIPRLDPETVSTCIVTRKPSLHRVEITDDTDVDQEYFILITPASAGAKDTGRFAITVMEKELFSAEPPWTLRTEGLPTPLSALEALGKLSTKVGHDFNNLLGSMRGCVDLISSRLAKVFPADNPVDRQLKLLENAIRKASTLSNKLRSFVRPGPNQAMPVAVSACVENALAGLVYAGVPREVVVVNADADPTIVCSQFMISQLLVDMIQNAYESMANLEDRQVVIHVEDVRFQEGLDPDLPAGRYARVSIMDHGPGVPDRHRQSIFTPFFTTKADGIGKGFGLSLVMAKEIMRKHGGDLLFISVPDFGTVVHLYFPIRDGTTDS